MFAALPPAPPATVVMTAAAPMATGTTHVVRPGESVYGIAARYGVTRSALRAANGLTSASVIHPGDRLVIPGRTAAATRSAAGMPAAGRATSTGSDASRTQVRATVESTARNYGVDPHLALAVAWQESRWRQHGQISSAGAVGVMQCMPSTAAWISTRAGRSLNIYDLGDNVTCGVLTLKSLTERTGGNERLALAGYYQGLASVTKRGMYNDTQRYVSSVMGHRAALAAGQMPRG